MAWILTLDIQHGSGLVLAAIDYMAWILALNINGTHRPSSSQIDSINQSYIDKDEAVNSAQLLARTPARLLLVQKPLQVLRALTHSISLFGRYNGSGFYQVDGGVDDRYSINGNLSALSPWSRWN